MPDSDISLSVQAVRSLMPEVHVGIILGSGLGAAAQQVADNQGLVIPYSELPGMPQTQVAGHEGRLVLGSGELQGVALLQGRVHSYEGHAVDRLTFATRMLAELGMQTLIVSNAAGGIQAGYSPGDLMLIDGHWTLCDVQERDSAKSSLGKTVNSVGRCLWSSRLLQLASSLPSALKIHQGCYAMMSGPNYEAPAEIRMLRGLGCQAVGMSTIPEALAAARRGIEVLGISCITNVAAGLSDQPLDHSEVSETAGSVETEFVDWLFRLVKRL
ncbi:MAG: purine-nucleoside phosphorylase [Fuerstiella sp.]